MSEVLRLEGVEKAYARGSPAEVVVLRGANLSVSPGEAVALVAPSGSGKSTLLHIAGLLDAPDSGNVSLQGASMTNASERARTRARRESVGFVYQFHHLLPEFSALENVLLPQLANGVPEAKGRARAMSLLEQLDVAQRATHRPAALSGGEQQRVALARALANDPALLLADEPTGNLDPATSELVFGALMAQIRDAGLSALIATHNLELASRLDRVVKLQDGKLVEA